MARKPAATSTAAPKMAPKAAIKAAVPAQPAIPAAVTTSPVRNSPIPKAAPAAAKPAKEISYEQIARRAYEIWQSGTGGSQEENWFRAERELRQGA